jgi:hypothetical protein
MPKVFIYIYISKDTLMELLLGPGLASQRLSLPPANRRDDVCSVCLWSRTS